MEHHRLLSPGRLVVWAFFTCRCSLFFPGIRLGRSRGASVLRTSQSGNLCDPCGRLVYSLADHASAYVTVGIVALRINRALRLRYWIGLRDQEGVTTVGRTNFVLPAASILLSNTRARRLLLHPLPAASGTAH